MSFFTRLFPGRDHGNPALTIDPPPASALVTPGPTLVAEELFIDREAPMPEARTQPASSRLKQLAAMDRTEEGCKAGYDYHDLEICRQMKERIKAEILCELEQEVGRIGLLTDQLDVEIRRIQGGGMDSTLRELQARREQMERHRMKLHEQQLMVQGNSGYAELPLTSFEVGFKQGYQAYLEATGLINKYLG